MSFMGKIQVVNIRNNSYGLKKAYVDASMPAVVFSPLVDCMAKMPSFIAFIQSFIGLNLYICHLQKCLETLHSLRPTTALTLAKQLLVFSCASRLTQYTLDTLQNVVDSDS